MSLSGSAELALSSYPRHMTSGSPSPLRSSVRHAHWSNGYGLLAVPSPHTLPSISEVVLDEATSALPLPLERQILADLCSRTVAVVAVMHRGGNQEVFDQHLRLSYGPR